MMSARACVIWSGARGSSIQPAKRSAMRSRCSTSRSIRTPPSDDNKPPSNVATTDLPETGDRPGNGSVELIMADVVSQKCCGFESITESYAPSKACATFGSLLEIIWGRFLGMCVIAFCCREQHENILFNARLDWDSFQSATRTFA